MCGRKRPRSYHALGNPRIDSLAIHFEAVRKACKAVAEHICRQGFDCNL
jgi:hypothetical protein